jgi:hypothetical protein
MVLLMEIPREMKSAEKKVDTMEAKMGWSLAQRSAEM